MESRNNTSVGDEYSMSVEDDGNCCITGWVLLISTPKRTLKGGLLSGANLITARSGTSPCLSSSTSGIHLKNNRG